jgi:type II secretory pathway component PulJ
MNLPARVHTPKRQHWPTSLRCAGQWHPLTVDLRSLTLPARRGLSLMELLIATTISIMLMAATVTLFGVVGDKVNAGRAMIETGDRVREVRNRLSADLRGATASMLPWEKASSGSGYFEIIKGPPVDTRFHPDGTKASGSEPRMFNRDANNVSTTVGYTRDVLMLTTRSRDVPFTGRFTSGSAPTTIESQVAEVVWYMQPTFNSQGQMQSQILTDNNGNAIVDSGGNPVKVPIYTLYRRQFLVVPSPTVMALNSSSAPWASYANKLEGFYDYFDISAYPDGNGNMVANSLSDLAYRENRFAHDRGKAPYTVNPSPADPAVVAGSVSTINFDALIPFQPVYSPNGAPNPAGSLRYGEDVALTNVLSFDIKVWDPGAEVQVDSAGHPLVPSDPGYDSRQTTQTKTNFASPPSPPHFNPPQFGAYVDLNYTSTTYPSGAGGDTDGYLISNVPGRPDSYFAGPYYGSGKKSLMWAGNSTAGFATYDSWSQGYEYYAIGAPTGTYNYSNNGFDNDQPNGANGVNDAGERLTSPPYPVPLRGVQIKIRVYEPTSRQVREVTVTETFLPD